jgi:hypothetical protein
MRLLLPTILVEGAGDQPGVYPRRVMTVWVAFRQDRNQQAHVAAGKPMDSAHMQPAAGGVVRVRPLLGL